MDKTTLKSELLKVATAFESDGSPFDVAGIMPVFPDLTIESYIFQVHAGWLNDMSHSQALDVVIDKLYELLKPDALRYVNRVEICVKPDDIRCIAQDIIVNRINFQPLVVPYSYFQLQY